MFVGNGAKLVRDAFALAKEKRPAINIIDELDAIGIKRFDPEKDRKIQKKISGGYPFLSHSTYLCNLFTYLTFYPFLPIILPFTGTLLQGLLARRSMFKKIYVQDRQEGLGLFKKPKRKHMQSLLLMSLTPSELSDLTLKKIEKYRKNQWWLSVLSHST